MYVLKYNFLFTVFDATAKLPSGILSGNVNQYGDFDECMELPDAQYCLAEIDIESLWKDPFAKFKPLVHSYLPIVESFNDVSKFGKLNNSNCCNNTICFKFEIYF